MSNNVKIIAKKDKKINQEKDKRKITYSSRQSFKKDKKCYNGKINTDKVTL